MAKEDSSIEEVPQVMNAGYREIQALLLWWKASDLSTVGGPKYMSFHTLIEAVRYDNELDAFIHVRFGHDGEMESFFTDCVLAFADCPKALDHDWTR